MTPSPRSLTPWRYQSPCHHGGHHPPPVKGGLDERDHVASEYGRGAEMLIARRYLGLERGEMATVLRVRETSYQRWENGQDPIPDGVWSDIEQLYTRFEDQVQALLAATPTTGEDPHRVRVWRGRTKDQPFPGHWQRIVSEARRRDPRITPVFPDDDE